MTMNMTTYGHGTGPRAQQAMRDQREHERLANDLARWAGNDAAAEHDRVYAEDTSYGVPLSHGWACCGQAREDGARNMYAFAMHLPMDALRRRHASELAERVGGS